MKIGVAVIEMDDGSRMIQLGNHEEGLGFVFDAEAAKSLISCLEELIPLLEITPEGTLLN